MKEETNRRRKEFGALVKALRTQKLNIIGPKWERKDLADASELSVRMIGMIERGDKVALTPETLTKLADALHLSLRERRSFFNLAAEVDTEWNQYATEPRNVFDHLCTSIENIYAPVFILDSYAKAIAANWAVARLYNFPKEYIDEVFYSADGFNLIKHAFAPDIQENFRNDLNLYNKRQVELFREITFKYRWTERFKSLMKNLEKIDGFIEYWAATEGISEDLYHDWDEYRYDHYDHGLLHYMSSISHVNTFKGELYIVSYIPKDKKTAKAFIALADADESPGIIKRDWPESQEEDQNR